MRNERDRRCSQAADERMNKGSEGALMRNERDRRCSQAADERMNKSSEGALMRRTRNTGVIISDHLFTLPGQFFLWERVVFFHETF